jgi:hypothetical protein
MGLLVTIWGGSSRYRAPTSLFQPKVIVNLLRAAAMCVSLSTALHQDPRYFRSRKKKAIPRAWYTVTRVLVTRSDDGHDTFNFSEFLGTLFTSSLQNAYYPERDRGFGKTMDRFLGAPSSDASSNLLREFWPDMRRISRKHAPEKIKNIERRLPQPP